MLPDLLNSSRRSAGFRQRHVLQPLSDRRQLIQRVLGLAETIAGVAVGLLIEINPLHHLFGRQIRALGADVDVDRLRPSIDIASDLDGADKVSGLVLAMQLRGYLVIPLEDGMQGCVVRSGFIDNEWSGEFAVLIGDPGQLLSGGLRIDTSDAGAGAE